MKLAIITCYKHPDYVRAKTLRAASRSLDSVEVIVVKNTQRGVLRYPEVLWRVLWVRLCLRPDVYLVTFRGYEIFPFVRILSIGKTMWYDEFINPIEWTMMEHKKLPDMKIFRLLYRLLVWPVQRILTDTESHADLSAEITGIDRSKIVALPVASDGLKLVDVNSATKQFTVFYYGTIKNPRGLHGVDIMAEAAVLLKDFPIDFQFVGGGEAIASIAADAKRHGARMQYDEWLGYDELMQRAEDASVCLGGPFGGTLQALYVITGKTYQFLEMGKPVIVGANKESGIFTDKLNALVVPQKDPQALAAAIRWAYEHRDQLQTIAANGHALYEEKMSVAVVAERLSKLFATRRTEKR